MLISEAEKFLVYASERGIQGYTYLMGRNRGYITDPMTFVTDLNTKYVGVDFDAARQWIYYSEVRKDIIYRIHPDGTGKRDTEGERLSIWLPSLNWDRLAAIVTTLSSLEVLKAVNLTAPSPCVMIYWSRKDVTLTTLSDKVPDPCFIVSSLESLKAVTMTASFQWLVMVRQPYWLPLHFSRIVLFDVSYNACLSTVVH